MKSKIENSKLNSMNLCLIEIFNEIYPNFIQSDYYQWITNISLK